MKILYPNHPLKARLPDPDYQAEFDAAAEVGFACEVYNLDELRSGDVTAALRPCANSEVEGQVILHRGWMMSDSHYAALCQEVLHKGYRMTVTPEAYRQAHYLPNAYPLIEGQTPVSKWMLEPIDIRACTLEVGMVKRES